MKPKQLVCTLAILCILTTAPCALAETEAQGQALFRESNPLKEAMGKPVYANRVFQHGYHCWDPALIKVGNTYHLFYSRWKMVPGQVNNLANWMTTSEFARDVRR